MNRDFASDNRSGICPEAWDALARANAAGHTPSYGEDPWTDKARGVFREIFETDCEVHFVFTGTAANSMAIASLVHGHEAVICHETAHIETSECGAPQFYSNGVTLQTCDGANGKLDVREVDRLARAAAHAHRPPPTVLSITQATEMGTTYSLAEVKELCAVARKHGLHVHMDGARFANAMATLACSPADATWRAGIDILSFGGTKNGMAMGEAVVFFPSARQVGAAAHFPNRSTQAGQLASKMRFISAQWITMLETGAWLTHATHANAMARRLATGLRGAPGVRVMYPVESNAVFAEIPPDRQRALRDGGWVFYTFLGETGCRLMCSWDTTEAEVDALVRDVRQSPENP
jgi:threonine aldolase